MAEFAVGKEVLLVEGGAGGKMAVGKYVFCFERMFFGGFGYILFVYSLLTSLHTSFSSNQQSPKMALNLI